LPILASLGCAPAGPFTRAAGAYAKVGTDSSVALGAYSSALSALAQGSDYDGTDLGKTVEGVDKIVVAVSPSAAGPAKAIGAVGKALDRFAGVVLRERVERDIEGYVGRADPEVQSLIVALRAYVAAARVDVESVLAGQTQMIATFEKLTGLGESAIITPCRVGPPEPVPVPVPVPVDKTAGKKGEPLKDPPESATLRRELETQRKALVDVCRTLDQLTKTTSASKLLAFHALALSADDGARQTRLLLTGFEEVLGQLAVAHAALAKAGQTKDTTDVQAVLGTISELVTRLGALQAGLATAKK
jgi:hypothetical protein